MLTGTCLWGNVNAILKNLNFILQTVNDKTLFLFVCFNKFDYIKASVLWGKQMTTGWNRMVIQLQVIKNIQGPPNAPTKITRAQLRHPQPMPSMENMHKHLILNGDHKQKKSLLFHGGLLWPTALSVIVLTSVPSLPPELRDSQAFHPRTGSHQICLICLAI